MKSFRYAALALCFFSSFASAHSAANEKNPYIVHRQAIYEIAGGHMGALKSILMLKHPAREDLNYHAKAMLDAFKHHGNAFPAGSDKGKTHAKKAIWNDPEGFKSKGQDAGKAMMALIEATEKNDEKAIKQSFAGVGKTCKSCHDDYRKKGS
ncbi:MAG: cytochrome c [Gammaproteobacteria bacterium]|nr:cytochrome c [Gammaproteobacteria bacterium]